MDAKVEDNPAAGAALAQTSFFPSDPSPRDGFPVAHQPLYFNLALNDFCFGFQISPFLSLLPLP